MPERTARGIALLGLAVVLAGALYWWKPFLSQERAVVTSTPTPVGVFGQSRIELKKGSQACVEPVAIDRATGRGQMGFASEAAGPVALAFEASAPGYSFRRELSVSLSPKGTPVGFELASPPRDLIGKVCVTNASRAPVSVIGTNEAFALGLARTFVDGVHVGDQSAALNLFEARPQSILDRLGTIVERAAGFSGLMPVWLTWLLMVVVVVGTPLAVFAAFRSVLRAAD